MRNKKAYEQAIAFDYNQIACQALGLILLCAIVLLSTGCSKRYDDMPAYLPWVPKEYSNESVGRFKSSYLAEQIDQYYRGVNPGPLGITTFVNIDDLNSTSTFGRMYAEQLMSELTMRGFDVVELRQSDALQFIDQNGEFGLSRHPGLVRREQNLGGIIVGTYTVSPVRVYVNARLVDPSTSLVLSAGSVEMGKSDEIARMLRGGAVSASLERIPVRHLGFSTVPMAIGQSSVGQLYDLEESGSPSLARPLPLPPAAPAFSAAKPALKPRHVAR